MRRRPSDSEQERISLGSIRAYPGTFDFPPVHVLMITLRKIIVATDFSRLGSCAVSRAALLAQEHGSELVLVHVIPDAEFEWVGATGPDGSAGTVFSREKFAQTALVRLSSTARGIEERYGVACQPKVDIRTYAAMHSHRGGGCGSRGPWCAWRTLSPSLVHGIYRTEDIEDKPVSNVAGEGGTDPSVRKRSRPR
jgi:hypothetical protein